MFEQIAHVNFFWGYQSRLQIRFGMHLNRGGENLVTASDFGRFLGKIPVANG